jgi:hypothetical protein
MRSRQSGFTSFFAITSNKTPYSRPIDTGVISKRMSLMILRHSYKSLFFYMSLPLLIAISASAEDNRADYDIDDDGLIEINDLQDLNEMRNHLNGTALYGDSTGCPESGCKGFELTTDLDFDTNQDGVMDADDLYWNEGLGWEPIGNGNVRFTRIFDGNGHVIRNLFINRPDSDYIGLFGRVTFSSAAISNLGLTGSLMHVIGNQYVGSVVGYVNRSNVSKIFSTGAVTGDRFVGGLIGYIYTGNLSESFSTGSVFGSTEVGSLIGQTYYATLNNSFSTGFLDGTSTLGGVVGDDKFSKSTIANSHWSTDTTQQDSSAESNIDKGYLGATLAQLQCPTGPANTSCSGEHTLYHDWATANWNFGTTNQLPGLIFGDTIYRDGDGDGVLDEDDAFPNNFAASQDNDHDGFADSYTLSCTKQCINNSGILLDQFPSEDAASIDLDLDGLPDAWNSDCNLTCQGNSGLTLDSHPNDTDNDGISNSDDNDDNNDGLVDADANSNGLIDINNLEQLNTIRFELAGLGRVLTEGGEPDNSGCPMLIISGELQPFCKGYELTTDIDFDTNQDGVMNESDTYWNDGLGWEPLGQDSNAPFIAEFNGNGHIIRNLYINRPDSNHVGLFGYLHGEFSNLHHIGLTGPLIRVTGADCSGSLVGKAEENSHIHYVFSNGQIVGNTSVGGLIGCLIDSTLSTSFASGSVLGNNQVGGLLGTAGYSTVSESLATGHVSKASASSLGGVAGSSYATTTNTYWATDTTHQIYSPGVNTTGDYLGATLTQLQCPTGPTNASCSEEGILYNVWSTTTWDFGTNSQLPGLIFGDIIYRDSDGDGALDDDDAFPNDFAASKDTDLDGFVDFYTLGCDALCISNSGLKFDQLPTIYASSVDNDLDGAPDTWNPNCDLDCQNNSGLTLDVSLNDSDNDGIVNEEDQDDNGDGIADADANSNGLIDINNLEQLNAIRFDLTGSGRVLTENAHTNNSGCPLILNSGQLTPTCAGYELTTDLDFDTNQDGVIDENDTYWNDGSGWEPIGTNSGMAFIAEFNGNGHIIRNLHINRPNTDYIGLFRSTFGELHNIGLTGPLMSIRGDNYVGALVGVASTNSTIKKTFSTGEVRGNLYTGGLIGYLNSATLTQSFSTGSVSGNKYVGGLIGYTRLPNTYNNFATGYVSGTSYTGGMFGYDKKLFLISGEIKNSYWAVSTTKKMTSARNSSSEGYFGATLEQLQCPTNSNNTSCSKVGTFYDTWDSDVWDFGTDNQLPGLIFGHTTYRDSDGDGALDEDDAFPYEYAASQGNNADNIAEFYTSGCDARCIIESGLTPNQFPKNDAVSLDTDLDGLPDAWNTGCDINCQNNSGISLDIYPNDSDNDGIPNNIDTDDNNDGITDADSDSNGLIEISNLDQLNAIRLNLDGSGRVLVKGVTPDNSGCPATVIAGTMQALCIGYELTTDLNFDTNQDNVIDNNDSFWNDGLGWEPIGENSSAPFSAIFDGNNHVIRNLYINRSESNYIGLFGYTSGELTELRNIGLIGPLMEITGNNYVGALVGHAYLNSSIKQTFSTGRTAGNEYVGGLVGWLYGELSDSFTTGSVYGSARVGGLIGYSHYITMKNSFTTSFVSDSKTSGGIIGSGVGLAITDSHWAINTTQQHTSSQVNLDTGYFGTTLATLKCPTTPSNINCSEDDTLYDAWDASIWNFGNSNELPGLIFGNTIYRDSDGDGVLDEYDALPSEFAASEDKDNDGFADFYTPGCDISCIDESGLILDQFPASGAVSLDEDLDGLPDRWNSNCDIDCQNFSGIIIDTYIDDSDNDGIPNNEDTDDTNDGIIDADADSDGLIDINNIEQLNAMRFDLNGHGRVLTQGGEPDHSGCPFIVKAGVKQPLCTGYELTVNIDFDTNQDGTMNENDFYWNDGDGWQPVGTSERDPFTATFDGNGHIIRNLYINGSPHFDDYVGLFGYISGEDIVVRNLALSGPLMKITGDSYVGAIAGYAKDLSLQSIISTGSVIGHSYVGSITGSLSSGELSNSFASGSVIGENNVGGFIGESLDSSLINNLTTSYVSGTYEIGSLAGISINTIILETHWATDITDENNNTNAIEGYFGDTLLSLQCPINPTSSRCSEIAPLYKGWNNKTWSFGDEKQLPGLIFNNVIYRDSDGDGSLDEDDSFPTAFSASVDNDNDGYPDSITGGCDIDCLHQSGLIFDQFIGDPSAGKDTDFDGLPDEWSLGCDLSCQNSSSLTLDPYINDSDNDGITNTNDTDDNNDGIPNADIDSNGLIEINNLSQLNAIRFNLSGSGRVLEEGGDVDHSGCPSTVNGNIVQPICSGYELRTDLDFDTNQDGVMDTNDTYWNEGLGWEPIGNQVGGGFTSILNGNGHTIKNLYINRPESADVGLFGHITGKFSELKNLSLTGNLTKIVGGYLTGALTGYASLGANVQQVLSTGIVQASEYTGGLVGVIFSATMTQCFSSSTVTSNNYAGGLVGAIYKAEVSNSFALGSVYAANQAGGLIGMIFKGENIEAPNAASTISNSYSVGEVAGEYYVGGLIGESNDLAEITNSYWATDATTQPNSDGEDEFTGYIGTTLDELKCPTSANNTSCLLNTNMYKGWDSDIWHFGNESELPGLMIGDYIFRNENPISIEAWNIENQQFESNIPINNAPVIEDANNEARSSGGSGGGSVHFLWWVLLSSGLTATRKRLPR